MQMDARIGARLDKLLLSGFHRRLPGLIAAGMYFDSFDIYIAGTVLAAMVHSGESTLGRNATFVSVTFIGMMFLVKQGHSVSNSLGITALIVGVLGPETKHRSLEAIAADAASPEALEGSARAAAE